MAELFKNIYSKKFFDSFIKSIKKMDSQFDSKFFIKQIFDKEWDDRELKQRMRHISITLKNHLSDDFAKNAITIVKMVEQLQKEGKKEDSIEYMFFPDFIEVYGLDDYKNSIKAIEKITQFTSCEFGIRPFLIKYPKKGIQQMKKWSSHKHPMVRRLSTEGCRPRLPWAMAIPFLKKDPSPIIPILEKLKNDSSESVRRSVANNLNDISKDKPEVVIDLAKKWFGKNKELDWVVKHACRTLLKQGNQEVMELFGFGDVKKIKIRSFEIHTPKVKIGDSLEFSFKLINTSAKPSKLRLEYGLYYKKQNGSLSKKVFKISEKVYSEKSTTTINRKQSFRIITTRKYHKGLHQVSIVLNGNELDAYDFELV